MHADAGTPELTELEPRRAAVVHISGNASQLPPLLGQAFELTMQQIAASGAQVAGPPFARYLGFGEPVEAEVGFPYNGTLIPTEQVRETSLPGGRAVLMTHVGPYEEIGAAWGRVNGWVAEQGLMPAAPPWEVYLTGPEDRGDPSPGLCFPCAEGKTADRWNRL